MDLPTLTISASEGWLDQRKRFSSNIAGKEQKNYTLLKKGQLSYNHGNSKLAKYGVVYSLKNYEEALVPRVYHSFTVNSSINSDFIELVFATKLPDRELGKLVTSGARMDGLLNINYDDFMGIVITIPKIDEQKRIRNLFNMINKLITLHQRKLEQLEQLKNTLLSKMFPKSGTNIPEIRFSGFTDAWKQRKLGEVVIRLDNLRIPITESNRVSGPTPYYGANGIQDYVEGYTHDGEYILIAEDGANDTNNYPIFRVHGKIWVNNHAHVLQTIDDIADNDYVAYALKSINIGPYLVGGSRSKLNADSLMKLEIKLPKLSEQIKVGQIFVKIDYQIKNYKQKLKNLKTIKKSLLNKLFI
ncbi:restriction endonuclease subunit S [Enterococcus cecorum]|nr:restriction endonuclease subunit S [uncultured Enterococcus sp.]